VSLNVTRVPVTSCEKEKYDLKGLYGRGYNPAPQLENISWWGKNILRGGKRAFKGAKIYLI